MGSGTRQKGQAQAYAMRVSDAPEIGSFAGSGGVWTTEQVEANRYLVERP